MAISSADFYLIKRLGGDPELWACRTVKPRQSAR